MAGMAVERLGDLTLERAETYLARIMRQGRAAKTRDDVASSLKQYGEWGVDTERLARNPFRRLHREARESDRTYDRRPLSLEELE